MGNVKKSETFLLKLSDMNDRDAFIEVLRMTSKLMDRVNQLEKELKDLKSDLKAHENGGVFIHGDPEEPNPDVCPECDGCGACWMTNAQWEYKMGKEGKR